MTDFKVLLDFVVRRFNAYFVRCLLPMMHWDRQRKNSRYESRSLAIQSPSN